MSIRAALLWLLLFLPSLATAVEATDALGRVVRLEQPARRIVSLAPHATELLFAAGAGGRVVGVVERSDYPPEAGGLPRIGNYTRLDVEAILALEPDLLVAWQSGNSADDLRRLSELGLAIYYTEPRHLPDISRDLRRLGRLAGTNRAAQAAAWQFDQRLRQLKSRYQDQRPVRVFYQIWADPLMTLSGQSLVNDVIRLCGGVNIFAGEASLAPTVDVESVLKARPDAIVASGMAAERPEWLAAWRTWEGLPAVGYNALYHIHPDLIQRQGPRIIEGAEKMCQVLAETRTRMREEGTP